MADKTTQHVKGGTGASINIVLEATVSDTRVVSNGNWVGINQQSGDSGDTSAWVVDDAIYNFYIPDGVSVSEGDVVYIDPTDRTGNDVDDTAYDTAFAAGDIPLCKALADKDTSGGSGNHFVRGKSLLHTQGGQ